MEGPLGTSAKWIQYQGLPQSCPSPCPLGLGDRVVQTPNTCLGMSLGVRGEGSDDITNCKEVLLVCIGKPYPPQRYPHSQPMLTSL